MKRLAAVERFVSETRMGRGETTGYESALLESLRAHAKLLDEAESLLAARHNLLNEPE